MENYMRWKMMGGSIRLKRDVVPHIFDCQNFGETKSFSRRRVRVGRKKREELNKDSSARAPIVPIEWVDCGALDLSDSDKKLSEET